MKDMKVTRRRFLGSAAALGAVTIVPRHVLGGAGNVPPSEKLNIACIGVGGMGASDVGEVSTENIVALCDVDWSDHTARTFRAHPAAKKYRDFRKMLDAESNNIDAVTVSTPDHIHFVAALTAAKMGKHVYCQKPLCHDVSEVRRLTQAAREQGVMTQMGTQIHATTELKMLVEMIKSGVIGTVRNVDIWSYKDYGGGTRPEGTPPVPETLAWDLWLGPAPQRPYHPTYLPGNWRRWWDFGTGTLGDMACHILDPAWWALDLEYPTSIEAKPGPFNNETYPEKTIVTWEFPARGGRPAVTVTWYDGENRPPRPPELEAERDLPGEGGLYYGDKGTILCPHMGGPRLIPESRMRGFKPPEPFLPRSRRGASEHYQEWIRACKGGSKPLSNFDYSGPMSEAVLLGNVAARAGQKLEWDGPAMKVTNLPEANRWLRREYREGWSV
ncbi:MAG: Gfo/Idh/MocA family oxidoreductase [Sedimentisphaerales bacterium]|nr:Gfo/Idh/MocA family oxidoreductase [Sedimentisphaerales bacterium]